LRTATAIGANNQAAQAILKSEYTPSMSVLAARKLALKVLKQTMDSTRLMPEKVEVCEVAYSSEVASQEHIRFHELCDWANSAVLPSEI
jgi:20S proteasome subunit alpha 3